MTTRPDDYPALAGKIVCLVSSGHIGSNPRLVKEADALAQAGARVTVVATNRTSLPEVQERDNLIIGQNRWASIRVEAGGRIKRAARALLQRLAGLLFSWGLRHDCVAAWAYDPLIATLAATASTVPADLYIAHNLAALPAAHAAARRHNARLGFDAEDFHSGQMGTAPRDVAWTALIRQIEQRYLPRCDYLTAASPGIGRAYADAYGLPQPVTILNVFSRQDAPERPKDRVIRSPSLYWFSQTIGPGRGLEAVVRAIAASQSRPTLTLQGTLAAGYGDQLTGLADQLGVADRLNFLAPAHPAELARLAAQYDAGLATEPGETINSDICLSNKVFTYFLAGTAILATDTQGQRLLAQEVPDAFEVLPLADHAQWAGKIDALLLAPQRLAVARASAWRAGHERFCWEREQHLFLAVVSKALQSLPTA